MMTKYEKLIGEPENPSLIIESDKLDLQQCVDKVIEFLLKQGLITLTKP